MSYRNCTYNYRSSTIRLDHWDDDGKPITEIYPHSPHLYYEHPSGTYNSMYGTKLNKVSFNSSRDRKVWINQHSGTRIFESLPPAREFLLDRFIGQERELDFRVHPFKIYTIDIEIETAKDNTFPEATEANYPINVITIHNSLTDQRYIWYMPPTGVVPNIPKDIPNRTYYGFTKETDLLVHFLRFWKNSPPDIVTGWNVLLFDMPYIVNRSRKILGSMFDSDAHLSPMGNVWFQWNSDLNGDIVKITGLSILDYWYLLKYKFDKQLESYKLDDVLQSELGIGKLDHSEHKTFYDFYTKDFSKYIEYNIRDVDGVVELDKKKKFIDLATTICNIGLVEYEAIYNTLPYVQGCLTCQARRDGKIYLSDNGLPPTDVSFRGGYVYETEMKYYDRGEVVYDLNSLYPAIMRTINISPETKIGKVLSHTENEVEIRLVNGTIKTTTKEKFKNFLDTACTMSANGALFIKPEKQEGIMPKFLTFLYEQRKKIKADGIELEQQMAEHGDDETLKDKASMYDNIQLAFKILLNSVYGINGLRSYCCFDVDVAEAVTVSGQNIIIKSSEIIADIWNERYKDITGGDMQANDILVAGDTDSIMVDASIPVKKLFETDYIDWKKSQVNKLRKELIEVGDILNNRINTYVLKRFKVDTAYIEFKMEKIASQSVHVAKKNYIMRLVDKEGVYMVGSDKEFLYTGVEIKKKQIPLPLKDKLRYAIETGMKDRWTSNDYTQWLEATLEEFKNMPIEEIAIKHTQKKAKDPIGFLQMQKYTHIFAKVNNLHNQIIKDANIVECTPIRLNEPAQFIYVKQDNKYQINAIAFKDNYPDAFREMFEPDYNMMFEKFVVTKLKKIAMAIGWNPNFDPNNVATVDIFNL